jgi:hypothetical protein
MTTPARVIRSCRRPGRVRGRRHGSTGASAQGTSPDHVVLPRRRWVPSDLERATAPRRPEVGCEARSASGSVVPTDRAFVRCGVSDIVRRAWRLHAGCARLCLRSWIEAAGSGAHAYRGGEGDQRLVQAAIAERGADPLGLKKLLISTSDTIEHDRGRRRQHRQSFDDGRRQARRLRPDFRHSQC